MKYNIYIYKNKSYNDFRRLVDLAVANDDKVFMRKILSLHGFKFDDSCFLRKFGLLVKFFGVFDGNPNVQVLTGEFDSYFKKCIDLKKGAMS